MYRHKFRVVTPAQIMNRVGGQFLARAAFAFDQDAGRRRRDLSDGIEHLAQGERFAENIFQTEAFVDLLTQSPVLLLHPARLQCARDQDFDLIEVERFGHEIVSAAFHRFHGGINRTVSRHHDANRRVRRF